MAVETVSYEDLGSYLSNLPDNTPETPYELNITDIPESALDILEPSAFLMLLMTYPTKYVDLSHTILPNGVTSLLMSFTGCTSLVKAPVIPDSVTNMKNCFTSCTSLTEAPVIPDSVTDIRYCFDKCTSLIKAPVIPNSVINIGGCFRDCTSLVKAPVIPDSVTNMENCFSSCTSLIEAPVIPDSVTNIYGCFTGCTSLKVIDDFKSTNFKNYSKIFNNCTSLERIGTENEYVRAKVFSELTNIQSESSDNIPSSLNLKEIVQCDNNIVPFVNLDDYLNTVLDNTTSTPYEINITDIPSSATYASSQEDTIGYILQQYPTKYLDLNDTVISNISNSGLFSGCTSLVVSPVLPEEVESIDNIFENCTNLKKVTNVPDVEWLRYAFDGCTSLEYIYSWCVTDVMNYNIFNGYDASFHNCNKLKKIYTNNLYTKIITIDNLKSAQTSGPSEYPYVPASLNIDDIVVCDNNIVPYKDLGSFMSIIPENTSSTPYTIDITDLNTQHCQAAETSETDCVSNKIKSYSTKYIAIEESAEHLTTTSLSGTFKDCSNLVSFDFENQDILDMTACFKNCENFKHISHIPGSVKDMTECFFGCVLLEEVPAIPDGVLILEKCFEGCDSLNVTPYIPDSVVNMANCFKNCINISQIPDIPSVINDISGCFYGCTSLSGSVVIPDSVVKINDCFNGCTNITSISVDASNVSDASNCFMGCSSLQSFDIATFKNVQNCTNMFKDCSSLTTITNWNFDNTYIIEHPEMYTNMLSGTSPDLVIKVPIEYNNTEQFNLLRISSNDGNMTITKNSITESEETSVTVPYDTGDELEFGSNTDELAIGAEVSNEAAKKMLKYRYPWGNTGLDPDNSNFVLWAREGSNIVSNVTGEGGGTVYSVPIGTIMMYTGNLDKLPVDWKECNGEVLQRTAYPEMYKVSLPQFIIDKDTFRLPDLRETTIVGAGENTTNNDIETHDIYEVGEFKDDQIQSHTHTLSVKAAYLDSKANNSLNSGAYSNSVKERQPETTTPNGARVGDTTHGKQYGAIYIIKVTNSDVAQLKILDDTKVTASNVWSAYKVNELLKELNPNISRAHFGTCITNADSKTKSVTIQYLDIQAGTKIDVLFMNGNTFGTCLGTDSNIISEEQSVLLSANNETAYPIKVGGEYVGENFVLPGDVHTLLFTGTEWIDMSAEYIYADTSAINKYKKLKNHILIQSGKKEGTSVTNGTQNLWLPYSSTNYKITINSIIAAKADIGDVSVMQILRNISSFTFTERYGNTSYAGEEFYWTTEGY